MLLLDIRGVRIATMAVFGITDVSDPYRHYGRFYPRVDRQNGHKLRILRLALSSPTSMALGMLRPGGRGRPTIAAQGR